MEVIMITRLSKISLIGIVFIFVAYASLFAQCPPDYPISCGNGYCCPLTHPTCLYGANVGKCSSAGGCPSAVVLDNDESKLAVLREMRDVRIAGSCMGTTLIDLYYEHAEEVSEILRDDQDLKMMAATVVGEIVEKAAALNNNEEVSINQELVGSILSLTDKINANASPDLKKAIQRVKREIKKGALFEQLGITLSE
jgi:hypothetical protein